MTHLLQPCQRCPKHVGRRGSLRAARLALLAATSLCLFAEARAQEAVELESIHVEGEGGDAAVQGYIAPVSRTGSKTDTPFEKTPQTVNVVTRQQIEDQSAKSVAEALRYTPGVFTEYRGSSNLHDEMFVRGFSYVPRYLDGLIFGSGSFGQIDPYLLERIEVMKGPASVLYGQANPGGIVNMVSKMPSFDARREVFLSTGSQSRAMGGFDITGPASPDLAYRLVGVGFRVNGQEDYVKQERFAIAPSLTWQPSAQTKLTLLGFYQNEPDAGFRNFLEAQGTLKPTKYGYVPRSFFIGDPSYDKYERKQGSIGYQFEHRFNDMITVRQNARYSVIDTDFRTLVEWSMGSGDDANIFTRRAGAGPEKLNQFVIDNQAQFDLTTGILRHKVLTGVDYQWSERDYKWGYAANTSTIDWTNPVYGNPGDTNVIYNTSTLTNAHQTGIYLQDQIELGRLNLLFGVRQDFASTSVIDRLLNNQRTSFDDSAVTWRTGAIYAFDNGLAPYASYSTSFEPTREAPASGEPPFKPTEGEQFEVGLKFAPRGAPYQITASYYDLKQMNVLTRATWTDPYTQIGEIHNRGFELEARAEVLDGLTLLASFSHIKSEVTESLDTGILGKMPARIPRNQGSFWAKYEFRGNSLAGLALGGGVRYIGESWGDETNTFTVPDATLFDAMISYDFGQAYTKLKGLALQVNAANLADRRYVASCASAYGCFYGMGRTITAQLKYTW